MVDWNDETDDLAHALSHWNENDDDSYVSHTFDHWIRDLKDFKNYPLNKKKNEK